jgi:hypothetical protein
VHYLRVRLLRDRLDDRAQQKIAGVVIEESAARLELEIPAAVLLDELTHAVGIAAHIPHEVRQAGVTRDAGRVREQMMHGDFGAGVFSVVRQDAAQRGID